MIELDFVRGISILLVLVHHYHLQGRDHLGVWNLGNIGVDMFFVLSGFLVGGLLLKEWRKTGKVQGIRFLQRRAFKIWPSYYVFILFAILIHSHPYSTTIVSHLLNVQNYFCTSPDHTWTLAVEEHFYLILTLFMIFACSRHLRPDHVVKIFLTVMLVVATMRMTQIYWDGPMVDDRVARQFTHFRIDSLLYGVVLATVFNFWPNIFELMRRHRMALWLVVVGAYVLLSVHFEPVRYINFTLMDLGCAAFLLLMFKPVTRPDRNWLYRSIAFIGVYSYGIYLWHFMAGSFTVLIARHMPATAAFWFDNVVRYPAAILVGIVMTKAIEFPFLKLREKLIPSAPGSHLLPEPTTPREPDKAW